MLSHDLELGALKKLCIVLLLTSAVTACAPKVKLSPQFASSQPSTIALLGIKTSPETRKERLQYIQRALRSELKSRGYLLLDENIVSRVCSSVDCRERSAFKTTFPVDAVVQLTLKNDSQNAFLLGHFNLLSGSLLFSDLSERELARVEHTESERGGLLFNSGQVLQGLKEEFENYGDDSFNRLADRFTKNLVAQLPRNSAVARSFQSGADVVATKRSSDIGFAEPEFESIQVRPLKAAVYEICTQSPTPAVLAALIVGRKSSPLRETTAGRYCGIYRLDNQKLLARGVTVELRTPFGATARKEVSLVGASVCDLQGRVSLTTNEGPNRLAVSCLAVTRSLSGRSSVTLTDPHRADSQQIDGCAAGQQLCTASKLLVYRANSAVGPFEKVAEIASSSWADHAAPAQSYYQVIAVGENGALSLPAAPL